MSLKNALLAVGGLLLVLVVAFIAVIHGVDLNDYRRQVAQAVQDATGRRLTLRGDVELSLSFNPTLMVTDAAFANADWGSRSEMLSIGRLGATVALLPLLTGEVRIKQLRLSGVELLLERGRDGVPNWRLPATPETGADPGAARLPGIQEVLLEDLVIQYRDAERNLERMVTLPRAWARAATVDEPLSLDLLAMLDDQPLRAHGTVDSLRSLAANSRTSLDLTVEGAPGDIHLEGVMGRPWEAGDVELAMRGSGENLADWSRLAGRPLPATRAYRFSLKVQAATPGKLQVVDLLLQAGDSALRGGLLVDVSAAKPVLEMNLEAEQLRLEDILREEPATPQVAATPRDKLFSREPLALQALQDMQGTARLRVRELRARDLVLGNVFVALSLDDGVLKVSPAGLEVAGGQVEGEGRLDSGTTPPELTLEVSGRGINAGRLLQELTGEVHLEDGATDLRMKLRGNGHSLAELMASLDGEARLLVADGRMRAQTLDNLVGGVTTLAGTLLEKDSATTILNCAAMDFVLDAGIANSRVILVDTEHATVAGKGSVDLGEETLDLIVKPEPKSVTLNVAVPVEIGGTLAQPSFTPSKIATTRKALGVLAVVGIVFPPAAVVGLTGVGGGALAATNLGELGSGGENPCIALAASRSGDVAADGGSATKDDGVLEKTKQGVQDAVEGIGKAFKGLFGD